MKTYGICNKGRRGSQATKERMSCKRRVSLQRSTYRTGPESHHAYADPDVDADHGQRLRLAEHKHDDERPQSVGRSTYYWYGLVPMEIFATHDERARRPAFSKVKPDV